jgi:large subunit ribosomal protein L9
MAKRVQLVLNKYVNKLGRPGDVVDVTPGYARNYLIPQGLGMPATAGVLKQAERLRAVERQRQEELKQEALQVKTQLEAVEQYTITKQAGEKDSIFGSITDRDVAAAIQEATGRDVDRHNIVVPDIRKLGAYTAELKLHPEVTVSIPIEVVPQ